MPVEPRAVGSNSARKKRNTDQCDRDLGDHTRS
jgi:hypothetical protein